MCDAICSDLDVAPGIGFDLAEKNFEGLGEIVAQSLSVRDAGHVVLLANLPFLQLGDQVLNVADLQGVFFTNIHGWSPLSVMMGAFYQMRYI